MIKANTQVILPVLMVSSSDFITRNTGIVYGSVTCEFIQPGSTTLTSKSITAGNWTESGKGIYWITFLNTDIGSNAGKFTFTISVSGNINYEGSEDVVLNTNDNIDADVQTAITNIATANSGITSINNKTTNLPASPAAVSDITNAITNIKGASNKDLSQVDTDVNTAITDILAVKTKSDNLPANPTSETNATNNTNTILAAIAVGPATEQKNISVKHF